MHRYPSHGRGVDFFHRHRAAFRFQVIGVDPGIRNTFYARTSDGRRIVMSSGEFDSLAHLDDFRRAQARRVASAGLPDLPRRRTMASASLAIYRATLLGSLSDFLDLYGSEKFLHDRLTVRHHAHEASSPTRLLGN